MIAALTAICAGCSDSPHDPRLIGRWDCEGTLFSILAEQDKPLPAPAVGGDMIRSWTFEADGTCWGRTTLEEQAPPKDDERGTWRTRRGEDSDALWLSVARQDGSSLEMRVLFLEPNKMLIRQSGKPPETDAVYYRHFSY